MNDGMLSVLMLKVSSIACSGVGLEAQEEYVEPH